MRSIILLVATMALTLLAVSGVALAVTKIGTAGPDTLMGTKGSDELVGRGSSDWIDGLAGVGFGDPAFAAGYGRDLVAATLIAIACLPIAAWSFKASGTSAGGPREDTSRPLR